MTYRRSKLFTLVDTAKKMVAGEIGPIEGSRAIMRLPLDIDDDEKKAFDPFLLIDSESDDLVVGNRGPLSAAFLEDIDRRYAAYEAVLRPGIAADCEALIAVIEPRLRECAACGFSPLKRMPYDAAGDPSYEECPCCDFQPGVTDEIEYDVAEWRRRWVGQGSPFRHPSPPADWNPAAQLEKAGLAEGGRRPRS